MKPFILILSTAALALAGPIIPTMAIIPTMVYDLPSISTSTSAPATTPTSPPFIYTYPYRFHCMDEEGRPIPYCAAAPQLES